MLEYSNADLDRKPPAYKRQGKWLADLSAAADLTTAVSIASYSSLFMLLDVVMSCPICCY